VPDGPGGGREEKEWQTGLVEGGRRKSGRRAWWREGGERVVVRQGPPECTLPSAPCPGPPERTLPRPGKVSRLMEGESVG
jgi:hypothetical protein